MRGEINIVLEIDVPEKVWDEENSVWDWPLYAKITKEVELLVKAQFTAANPTVTAELFDIY